eukprot:6874610-Prymnesium_polylepis.1
MLAREVQRHLPGHLRVLRGQPRRHPFSTAEGSGVSAIYEEPLRATEADEAPLVYARTMRLRPGLVFVGTQPALLRFLSARHDVMSALGISEVLPDGFRTTVKVKGKLATWTKIFNISQVGESVVYLKAGYESMACSKPLDLFELECQFGPSVVLSADLRSRLEVEDEDDASSRITPGSMDSSNKSPKPKRESPLNALSGGPRLPTAKLGNLKFVRGFKPVSKGARYVPDVWAMRVQFET